MAKKRLLTEYNEWQEGEPAKIQAPPNSTVRIINPDPTNEDFFHWEATLEGPCDSPYRNGKYILDVVFPTDYPFKPPSIAFQTPIYHCNVHPQTWCIELSYLRDSWSPALTLSRLLTAIHNLMVKPDTSDHKHDSNECIMCELHSRWRSNLENEQNMAKTWNIRYATQNQELTTQSPEIKQAVMDDILRLPPQEFVEPALPASNTYILPFHKGSSTKSSGKKKQVQTLLKEARLFHQLKEFEIIQVRDEADAKRKLMDMSSLNNGTKEEEQTIGLAMFPFLYLQLRPTPGEIMVSMDLRRRLLDMGCIPADLTHNNLHSSCARDGEIPPAQLLSETKASIQKRPFVYDMETSDPDDVLTLLYLLSAPAVDLRLITINPGTRDQVGLIYSILQDFGLHHKILIGSGIFPHKTKKEKTVVDVWYKRHFRSWLARDADGSAAALLCQHCNGNTTLVTGGAWTNVARAIRIGGLELGTLVAQGGFASASVCGDGFPQLEKFQGQEYMSSYNMNANPKAVKNVAQYQGISNIRLVSKNICHREVFNQELLQQLPPDELLSQGLAKIKQIMTKAYFSNGATEDDDMDRLECLGKKIHDILAAACAISPDIAIWRQVEIVGKSGAWGTRLSSCSRIFITVDYDSNKFRNVFLKT